MSSNLMEPERKYSLSDNTEEEHVSRRPEEFDDDYVREEDLIVYQEVRRLSGKRMMTSVMFRSYDPLIGCIGSE
jgi:hypothetical protein